MLRVSASSPSFGISATLELPRFAAAIISCLLIEPLLHLLLLLM
jgi:hypothetical protein